MSKKKKKLKKFIKDSLDQIEGESTIGQLMGEHKYRIGFVPGFEEDLVKILSETPEQSEKRKEEYFNYLKENILKRIQDKGEVVFVSNNFVLDHYLTDNKFNNKAYYNNNYNNEELSYKQFCKKELPELLEEGIIGHSELHVILEDSLNNGKSTPFIFQLQTRSFAGDKFKRDIDDAVGICNRNLIGDFSGAFGLFMTEEERLKDRSWKKDLWEDKIKNYETIIKKIDKNNLSAIKKNSLKYLKTLLTFLNDYKFQYSDEEEWDCDKELLIDYIKEIEEKSPYEENRDGLIFVPTKMNSVTVNDLAQNFKRWINKYINPKKKFGLHYGTRLDEMLVLDKILKKATERMRKIDKNFKYEEPESRANEIKFFQEKHNLNCLPYGKIF